MSNQPMPDRPERTEWYQSREAKAALQFVERTLIICGYMGVATAVILVATGDYSRAVPFAALGAVSLFWTWRKIKQMG